jgi:hypothetical protein
MAALEICETEQDVGTASSLWPAESNRDANRYRLRLLARLSDSRIESQRIREQIKKEAFILIIVHSKLLAS